MAKQKTVKKPRKGRGTELMSDKRTARFVAAQLELTVEQMGDLIPELRSLERLEDLPMLTMLMSWTQGLRKKYVKFADDGVWKERD